MSEADELAALKAEALAEEGATPEGEQAKPVTGEVIKKQDSESEWADIFQMVLEPTFAIVAPNWEVKGREVRELSKAYAAVAAKYCPEVQKIGVELSAVMTTAMIVLPRIVEGRSLRKVEKQQQEGGEDGAATTAENA